MGLLGRRICIWLIACCGCLPAWAGWFKSYAEDVTSLVPDAAIRLEFIRRNALGFDPGALSIKATYEASKPDEKGVRTETRMATFRYGNFPALILGGGAQKYKATVSRTLILPSSWIEASVPASLTLRVPETLPGPGQYRLSTLDLPCLGEMCASVPLPRRPGVLRLTPRTGRESGLSDHIELGEVPSSAFTAAYEGKLMALVPSQGSQTSLAEQPMYQVLMSYRALQDTKGQWHISANAFAPLFFHGKDSCSEPRVGADSRRTVHPERYPSMTWATRFVGVSHSEVYVDAKFGAPTSPDTWTGCVVIKGQQPPLMAGEEVRYYGFSEGRLAYRYSKSYDDKESFTEKIELDGAQQPLFVKWSHFVYSSAREEGGEWSRLAQDIFPPAKPLPVNVDMDALLREAEDVKKIIAHEFQPRVEP